MIAAPEHFVRRFQSRLQIDVVTLIELLAEIVPHVADPDDALVMEIELAADITVCLATKVAAQKSADHSCCLADFALDVVQLAVVLAPVIAQIGRVGVNSSCFPGTELGAQVPVRSAAAAILFIPLWSNRHVVTTLAAAWCFRDIAWRNGANGRHYFHNKYAAKLIESGF